jgi:magnesium-transporting ATPase (P-type)
LVYVKGAPKEVLALCNCVSQNDQVVPLDSSLKTRIMSANDDYARNGLRVLAVAYRHLPEASGSGKIPFEYTPESIERDLTFLGLIAMMDPPRPALPQSRSVIAPHSHT